MYISVCMRACICVDIRKYIRVYVYTFMGHRVYIYIYIYIYMYIMDT